MCVCVPLRVAQELNEKFGRLIAFVKASEAQLSNKAREQEESGAAAEPLRVDPGAARVPRRPRRTPVW